MTSGSSTIMLCADQAWEMVVCGERVGKHVFFARLPTSQRLHHPAHFRKISQHDEKRPHLAPRRGAAAHLARPPCAQITTPAAQHWPRRPWPSFCALWPRVPPCSTRRAPSTARHSVTTGRPRRRVVRRHRFPLRKTCHALLRRPRRPSSAATRPPGAVPSRPMLEPRPRAARSTGWTCCGRALAARRKGAKNVEKRALGVARAEAILSLALARRGPAPGSAASYRMWARFDRFFCCARALVSARAGRFRADDLAKRAENTRF